jgi:hypothetical protein
LRTSFRIPLRIDRREEERRRMRGKEEMKERERD